MKTLYLLLFLLIIGCCNKKKETVNIEKGYEIIEAILYPISTEGFKVGNLITTGYGGSLIIANPEIVDSSKIIGIIVGRDSIKVFMPFSEY